jgi:hypothetical protein
MAVVARVLLDHVQVDPADVPGPLRVVTVAGHDIIELPVGHRGACALYLLSEWLRGWRPRHQAPQARQSAPYQPSQSPQGWEHWLLWVTRKAIEADYLVHRDTPGAARSKRTHLVHATCHRSKNPSRRAGNTVLQQTT